MYAKIQIKGKVIVKTGLHIGGGAAFAAIGAVDSTVVRDTLSNLPMIPGSSFKGKMRILLAKKFNTNIAARADDDDDRITRLFGSAKTNQVHNSRILVSDMFLSNQDKLRSKGLLIMTEVKFENTINRATAVATPRQIERVIRGSEFNLDIVYEQNKDKENELLEDLETLVLGFKLLTYDYLGGSGSRGYGKIAFSDLKIETVIGETDNSVIDDIRQQLAELCDNSGE